MYKYVFTTGSAISVKTPKVNNLDEVKKSFEQSVESIKSHLEYPNGLIIDTELYADKIIWLTNKRIILSEDGKLEFEE